MARSKIISPEIGARVQARRNALDLSVADLAAAVGLKDFAIREIEKGRNIKGWKDLEEFARVLGTTPNVLLGFDPAQAPPSADQLDMLGATVQKILIDDGWPRERAEALVDIATEVALEKSELDIDRRLAAAYKRRALKPQP